MAPKIYEMYNSRVFKPEGGMVNFFKDVWNDGWAGKVLLVITPIVLWAIVNLDYWGAQS